MAPARRILAFDWLHLLRELRADEIAAMKQRPGKNMMIFGSGSIVSQLTQHGLIDEYLLETRKYPSGDISLRYAPRLAWA